MSQEKITTFLKSAGMEIKVNSPTSYLASTENKKGMQLLFVSFDNILGAQVDYLELRRQIIDASDISTVEELKFFIVRNKFLQSEFPSLIKALHQDQT